MKYECKDTFSKCTHNNEFHPMKIASYLRVKNYIGIKCNFFFLLNLKGENKNVFASTVF